MAGGGIKPGSIYGETDEFGWNITKGRVHVHDMQATILHLCGIDHEKLTFRYQADSSACPMCMAMWSRVSLPESFLHE